MEKCTQIYDGKVIRKLTPKDKRQIEKYIEEQSKEAMRNLGVAYKSLENYDPARKRKDVENDLVFLGCVSIIDPPREEVPGAIQSAYDAKIKVIMIT